MAEGSARVDQWLWAVRIFKTRSLATAACRAGHVRVNGDRAKAAQSVKSGDEVRVRISGFDRVLVVRETLVKRVAATVAVESYLDHQGQVFLERFDALSYLYLTRVMDYFDPFDRPDATATLAAHPVNHLVMSFDSDWRFSTQHALRIVRRLERARVPVTFREIASPWGHDSFLLDDPAYHATLRAWFDRALEVGV